MISSRWARRVVVVLEVVVEDVAGVPVETGASAVAALEEWEVVVSNKDEGDEEEIVQAVTLG